MHAKWLKLQFKSQNKRKTVLHNLTNFNFFYVQMERKIDTIFDFRIFEFRIFDFKNFDFKNFDFRIFDFRIFNFRIFDFKVFDLGIVHF